ncbi:MAG: hypothetical protein HY702_06720 [Gemmatimonadetes bacterium]|nr:hypothetical protein [Gemmatimonadota bacterium]
MSRSRIACVTIPDFPIVVHARGAGCEAEALGAAAVVRGRGVRGVRGEVAALSRVARECGLRPGMRLVEAKARVADLVVWRWDDRLYAQAMNECVMALLAASPRVAKAGIGSFWLEVGGWSRRGGEVVFAEVARGALMALGYPVVWAGIADLAVAAQAAQAASRWSGGPGGPGGPSEPVTRVPPGRDAEFLKALPIEALPISEPLLDLLGSLGVTRVGDLVRLGGPSLEARLGAEGLQAWRWACGLDERRPFCPVSEEGYAVSVELGGVETLEPLLFVLKSCLDRITADLGHRGECVRSLEMVLVCEGGVGGAGGDAELVRRVTPARPTRDVRVLLGLARAALEDVRLPGPVADLVVRAGVDDVAPGVAEQGELFEPRWVDPLAWSVGHARLVAKFGRDAVVTPEPRDAHRPEAGGRWVPVGLGRRVGAGDPPRVTVAEFRSADPGHSQPHRRARPSLVLHLLPVPAPIDVRVQDGAPIAIRLDGRWMRVRACVGPERLSGEWWSDPYHREYFRVLVGGGSGGGSGGLYWIFREGGAPRDAPWKLHGWWD